MEKYRLNINNKAYEVEAEPDTPLLWILRDNLALKGTKFGCGKGQCGACTVLMGDVAIRSCSFPVSGIGEQKITTIEGLAHEKLHPVQEAWIEEDVPQCGYCQGGQILQAVALLKQKPMPTDRDIELGMAGNICRCGTYIRIRKAIKKAAQMM